MLLIKSMDRLALKLIDIHWIHHLWIRKQEERHSTPEIRTWWMWSCDVKKWAMVTLGWNGYPFSCEEARMWWQVHKVRVASAQGARTGVSCGSTRSKKWHILGSVSLCKNWRNRANKASGRCLRLRALISSMRWSRSASAESKGVSIFRCVVPSARRSLSFAWSRS